MTITQLGYCGIGLSVDGAALHVTGMFVGVRPAAALTNAATAADPTTSKIQGIRPRRPDPA